MQKAKFITIEGGEGVGKTLFINILSEELKKLGINFILTREPGGTPSADKLRELFTSPPVEDPLVIEAEFCIVSAARAQHVTKKILPALKQNIWVLCDRFADSSRVYQGFLGGIPTEHIEYIIKFTTFNLEPDLTFVLDCPIDISLKRLEQRKNITHSKLSRFDKQTYDFHQKVREGFLRLQKIYPNRIQVINSEHSEQQMVKEALQILKQRFNI